MAPPAARRRASAPRSLPLFLVDLLQEHESLMLDRRLRIGQLLARLHISGALALLLFFRRNARCRTRPDDSTGAVVFVVDDLLAVGGLVEAGHLDRGIGGNDAR